MKKSPCKECKRHKTEFPGCMTDCKTIDDIQNIHKSSYDHSVKIDYDIADDLNLIT